MITIEETVKMILSVIESLLVSGAVGGMILYYIRKYIDTKLVAEQKAKAERDLRRKKMNMAEQERRHAEGRLLFWLHRAIVRGDHNGDLEKAMEEYQKAERAHKALEQEMLAEFEENAK